VAAGSPGRILSGVRDILTKHLISSVFLRSSFCICPAFLIALPILAFGCLGQYPLYLSPHLPLILVCLLFSLSTRFHGAYTHIIIRIFIFLVVYYSSHVRVFTVIFLGVYTTSLTHTSLTYLRHGVTHHRSNLPSSQDCLRRILLAISQDTVSMFSPLGARRNASMN